MVFAYLALYPLFMINLLQAFLMIKHVNEHKVYYVPGNNMAFIMFLSCSFVLIEKQEKIAFVNNILIIKIVVPYWKSIERKEKHPP